MIRPTMADLLDQFDPHGPGEDFPATLAAIKDALLATGPLLHRDMTWSVAKNQLHLATPRDAGFCRNHPDAADTPIPE